MGIRKPGLSVTDARRLASVRSSATKRTAAHASEKSDAFDKASAPPEPSTLRRQESSSTQRMRKPEGSISQAVDRKPLDLQQIPAPQTGEKVQVFLSAPLPASGVSGTFDFLCRQYPPRKALQMILRRAFDDYERLLKTGAFIEEPQVYLFDEAAAATSLVQTSRMIPKSLVAAARAHFDPLGLESMRAFGRKLGTAVLASRFAREGAGPPRFA
ncbi:hypothetical protein QE369_002070 [Agrobacterium larrymoorei]|uniref:Uncharacterized protein n=1 Tax=Agrobacterium larrymoorei TaxID=160699 RepID=A0AAJ2ESV2_9HYPH|nr:VirC2 family conjugal transfer protein [Agrobacterium larrymoorei]MDR6101873.1 hypothetical protein [Agrobacterium larrymoorei]